jgi:gamma-glutamyltranspeptidase / glutathione hydrolase
VQREHDEEERDGERIRRAEALACRAGDQWVTPASTTYHGDFGIYTTFAPSQAWGIVEEMNVLEACVPLWYPGQTLASMGPADPHFWHALIETKKAVYADVYAYNADPDVVNVPVAALTSKAHAASLCSKVDPVRASSTGPPVPTDLDRGDTTYLTTADPWGNMVSWVNSNFAGWGSGLTVPGCNSKRTCSISSVRS